MKGNNGGGNITANIEICTQCSKPLNEWLTYAESELEYIEQNEPLSPEFIRNDGFLISVILQSMPTMDCNISDYAKHQQGEILKQAIENREAFFQRVIHLAETVIEANI